MLHQFDGQAVLDGVLDEHWDELHVDILAFVVVRAQQWQVHQQIDYDFFFAGVLRHQVILKVLSLSTSEVFAASVSFVIVGGGDGEERFVLLDELVEE